MPYFIYLDFPKTPVFFFAFAMNICFLYKKLAVKKTALKYIAELQDPFKDKFMNGKSYFKLKSL